VNKLSEDSIYFFKRTCEAWWTPPQPVKGFVGKVRRVSSFFVFAAKSIFQIPGLLFQIVRAPKNQNIIFNHTKRVRRSGEKQSSLYVGRLADDLSGLIVVDEQRTFCKYPSNVSILTRDRVENLIVLSSTLQRFVLRIRGISRDRIEIYFDVAVMFWKWIFQYLHPRRIYLVVWYGKEWAIAAAKLLGIEVIELQHGVIFEEHSAYNIKDAEKIQGSQFLLPDECWTYGEFWRKQLLRSGWSPEKVKVCGYFLDVSMKQNAEKFTPYILYISQPEALTEIQNHILSIKKEAIQKGYKILIAPHPHPIGRKDSYDSILDEHIILGGGMDSYDLLRGSSVVIGVFSTMMWECAIFKKGCYMLPFQETPHFYNNLLSMGFARHIKNGEFPEPFLVSEQSKAEVFAETNFEIFS
jgi:hypothetical protein